MSLDFVVVPLDRRWRSAGCSQTLRREPEGHRPMAHRYRLYPTPEQEEVLTRHCNDTRFIWNLALEQFNHFDRRVAGQRPPSFAERGRQLPEIRRGTWLAEGSSSVQKEALSVQKEALRDFERACVSWWRGSHRRPTWRKAGRREGFCIRDVTIRKLSGRWATVQVPKCGAVRFRLSRPLPPDSRFPMDLTRASTRCGSEERGRNMAGTWSERGRKVIGRRSARSADSQSLRASHFPPL